MILFDGVCNLCHASVNWVIAHDPDAVFRFASLQSAAGRKALEEAGCAGGVPDSVVLIDEEGAHLRSTAAIRIAVRLGFPWALAVAGYVLPLFLRDGIYKWVAAHRYAWFGRQEACLLPSAELAARFLDFEPPRVAPRIASEKS